MEENLYFQHKENKPRKLISPITWASVLILLLVSFTGIDWLIKIFSLVTGIAIIISLMKYYRSKKRSINDVKIIDSAVVFNKRCVINLEDFNLDIYKKADNVEILHLWDKDFKISIYPGNHKDDLLDYLRNNPKVKKNLKNIAGSRLIYSTLFIETDAAVEIVFNLDNGKIIQKAPGKAKIKRKPSIFLSYPQYRQLKNTSISKADR